MGKNRMDRRDFLNQLGLTGLAFGLGAAGCGQGSEQARSGSETRALARSEPDCAAPSRQPRKRTRAGTGSARPMVHRTERTVSR